MAKQDGNGLSVYANEISWQKCTVTMGSLLISLPISPMESPSSKESRDTCSSLEPKKAFYSFSGQLQNWQYGLLKPESPQGLKNSFPSLNKLKSDMKATSVFLIHQGFQMGLFSHHVIPDLTGIPEMTTIQSSVLNPKINSWPRKNGGYTTKQTGCHLNG